MFIVNNTVDNTCSTTLDTTHFPNLSPTGSTLFSELHPASGGILQFYGTAVDSVIESNTQTDAAGIAAWSEYIDWTTSGAHIDYHTEQYFVDVRGNAMTNAFGGYENAGNAFGSGVELFTNSSLMVDGAVSSHPNIPGFGVSVSHNTLTDTTLTRLGWYANQSAGIALIPIQAPDESSDPGYLDTLVFANSIGGTSDTASGTAPLTSAIANGISYGGTTVGMPNYPQSTVICENVSSSYPYPIYSDWPDTGETTSRILCGSGCSASASSAEPPFAPGVVGCAGSVTWDQRATLCGQGYVPCSASEWTTLCGGASPALAYWTNDSLEHTVASASCQVATGQSSDTAGTLCCAHSVECAGGAAPTDFFTPTMVGCGGTVTFDQRATLCGPGFTPCGLDKWMATAGAATPTQDYWTNANPGHYQGTGSGSCEAVMSGGTACDANSPIRVCTPGGSPAGTDSFGNTCTLTECGALTYQNQHLGGCFSNPTAGTLCCASAL
jgi:hypothetical protein